MKVITIEQISAEGNVDRTFRLHKFPDEVEAALERIERAYNMDRTVVTVS